jgi:hypothetical protein
LSATIAVVVVAVVIVVAIVVAIVVVIAIAMDGPRVAMISPAPATGGEHAARDEQDQRTEGHVAW